MPGAAAGKLPKLRIGSVALASLILVQSLTAAPLMEARVQRKYNTVRILEGDSIRPATVDDVISGNRAVQTGDNSRVELMFPDNTLTRLGSNTIFSFKGGSREVSLLKGTMLFQIPKGVGGANIHTAAITAAITGTTGLVENDDDTVRIILLEGVVRVYPREGSRRAIVIRGGQMLVAPARGGALKDCRVLTVDIGRVMKTSRLLSEKSFGPLPPVAAELIERVVSKQDARREAGGLVATKLLASGKEASTTSIQTTPANLTAPASEGRTTSGSTTVSLNNSTPTEAVLPQRPTETVEKKEDVLAQSWNKKHEHGADEESDKPDDSGKKDKKKPKKK